MEVKEIMQKWLVAIIRKQEKVQFGIVTDEWKVSENVPHTDWGTKIGDSKTLSAYVLDSCLLPLKELTPEDARDLTPNEALKKYKDLITIKLLDGIKGEAITAEYEQQEHTQKIERQTSALKALLGFVTYS
jgi:hypothetical protein